MTQTLNQQLVQINALISAQNFAQAQSLIERLGSIESAKRPVTALRALLCAMQDKVEECKVALSELAGAHDSDKVETLLAAGSAAFRVGMFKLAISLLMKAEAQAPEHPLVNARLGACLLAMGLLAKARPYVEKAAQLMPDSGGSLLNLANLQLELKEPQAALDTLERAARQTDIEKDILNSLRAQALIRLGQTDAAVRQLRVNAESGSVQDSLALVRHLTTLGHHEEAWQCLRDAIERDGNNPELLEVAAELSQVKGRYAEADRFLGRALAVAPENAALLRRRALLSGRRVSQEVARQAANKALELTQGKGGHEHALSLATHAHVLAEESQLDAAQEAYREALILNPQCAPALRGLGQILMQLGHVDEAIRLYEELSQISPIQGWSQLIHARVLPEDENALQRMEAAARRPSLEGAVQSNLLFTLAAAWEKKGDYEKAWNLVTEANAATREHLNYRPEAHRSRIEREMARFSRAFMDSRSGWGLESETPVFVLGMPRSGTTLVEQILGSHSQIFGAGELSLVPELIQKLNAWEAKTGSRREYPECIDEMTPEESKKFASKHLEELQAYAPKALRIVDKLPHNFEHIGLIKLIFPKAKILHLKREPRDVAMSNFFVDYGAKFGGMGFAYDLSWIGEQLVDHHRMMQHWHQVFPGEIMEVNYDALVEDVQGWAERIIAYLGLDWEDSVLSFQALDRPVKTASVWQVRQPVYNTSKAKWRRYEGKLEPLELALSETPPMLTPMPLPQLEPGLFLQGMDHLKAKRLLESEACFRKLLSARPSHAAAHHFLGAALIQLGLTDPARKSMRRALELQPGQRQWIENLIRVEEHLGNTVEVQVLKNRLKRQTPASALTSADATEKT
jgi:tetratricopeptide (TPR) repeat protein